MIGRLLCRLGLHRYRYVSVRGICHMLCTRCGDASNACPYGLAAMEDDR